MIDTRVLTQMNKDKWWANYGMLYNLSLPSPFQSAILFERCSNEHSADYGASAVKTELAADNQWSRKWNKDFWIPHGGADTRTPIFPLYPVGMRAKKRLALGTKGAIIHLQYTCMYACCHLMSFTHISSSSLALLVISGFNRLVCPWVIYSSYSLDVLGIGMSFLYFLNSLKDLWKFVSHWLRILR